MLQFLLRLPTLMWRLLLIFQILWSSKQSMKKIEKHIVVWIKTNFHRLLHQFLEAQTLPQGFSTIIEALIKIWDFSIQRNYLSLFSTFLPTINKLDQFYLTKNCQTFSEEYMHHHRATVNVSAHESYPNNLDK